MKSKWICLSAVLCSLISISSWAQEPSAPTPTPASAGGSSTAGDSPWTFAIGGGYSLGSVATFNDMPGSSLTLTLTFENGFSLEGDARLLPADSWGFIGGFSYQSERGVKRVTVSSSTASGTVSVDSGDYPKIQATLLMGSAAYRWDMFYLPFGLNIGMFNVKDSATEKAEISGGMGLQVGAGFVINPNFVLEAWLHSTAINLKTTDKVTGTVSNYGDGAYGGLNLVAKYVF